MTVQNSQRFTLLDEWMRDQNVTLVTLAKRLQTSKSRLHRLLTGQVQRVDPALCQGLNRETAGKIGTLEVHAFVAQAGLLREAAE